MRTVTASLRSAPIVRRETKDRRLENEPDRAGARPSPPVCSPRKLSSLEDTITEVALLWSTRKFLYSTIAAPQASALGRHVNDIVLERGDGLGGRETQCRWTTGQFTCRTSAGESANSECHFWRRNSR